MARTTPRPTPTATRTLQPLGRHCPLCGDTMWAAYHNYRTITTLDDVVHRTLQIRRCLNRTCPQFHRPYRPEEEGRLALPKHEFGLDVIALVGTLRYAQHRSVPEIHHELERRRVVIAPRTVLHLLERYDELLALSLTDTTRLQRLTAAQPLPKIPPHLFHFHYLHEAAKPIYEADRHAKKELKKRVRGVRPLERQLASRSDPEAEVVRGYCAAVRSALTDDGRPPLDASGLKLHDRLTTITASLERVEKRGPCPRNCVG